MDLLRQACEDMEIDGQARAIALDAARPQAAVRALLERGHPQAALQLLARLLPKRYVVAWLCQCARDESLSDIDRAGTMVAERWVREPDEAQRRAAYEFATADGYSTLGGWLAATAGWSGGSLAPAAQDTPVPPPPFMTARAATAAVNLLAAQEPDRFDERRLAFATRAIALLDEDDVAVRPSARNPS